MIEVEICDKCALDPKVYIPCSSYVRLDSNEEFFKLSNGNSASVQVFRCIKCGAYCARVLVGTLILWTSWEGTKEFKDV